MKTKEELSALEEVETMRKKLAELNEEELAAVTGRRLWRSRSATASNVPSLSGKK